MEEDPLEAREAVQGVAEAAMNLGAIQALRLTARQIRDNPEKPILTYALEMESTANEIEQHMSETGQA